MRNPAEHDKSERLGGLEAYLRDTQGDAVEATVAFARHYYRQVDAQDVAARTIVELAAGALSLWRATQRRTPAQAHVRVFTPTLERDGWHSRHSVVELIHDDMPFLVDSVAMEVNRQGYAVQWLIHPLYSVRRDAAGNLLEIDTPVAGDTRKRESMMHIELDRIIDDESLGRLRDGLLQVLADVRTAVEDWQKMRERVQRIIDDLERRPPPVAADEIAEARAFLSWLLDGHYTFLGYRNHDLIQIEGQDALRAVPASGLGVLRAGASMRVSVSFATLPPAVRARARMKEVLLLSKSNTRATVHRPGYLDYVGIKRYDEHGEVCGEHRFLGLYTHTAYRASPLEIPVLRNKAAYVFAQAALPPGSHGAKALEQILDTYPRDELFQIDADDLARKALAILALGERQSFRLLVRSDPFERFVSCLIYAPREHYTGEVRRKWQAILLRAFGGTSTEFAVHLSESVLARVLITVRTRPGALRQVDVRAVEAQLVEAARRWDERLLDALTATVGEPRALELHGVWSDAFPAGYRDDHTPDVAAEDVPIVATIAADGGLGMRLYRPADAAPDVLRFKLFTRDEPIVLSHSMPMLERMGLVVLEERPYRVASAPTGQRRVSADADSAARDMQESGADREAPHEVSGPVVWIDDFAFRLTIAVDVEEVRERFEDAFAQVYAGTVENDGFNRLVLAAGLSAREATMLRAYAKYMRQIGFALSQTYIETTLANYPAIARMLVMLFALRFDPIQASDGDDATQQVQLIEEALDKVASLSEDRVLRLYLALILATTRTNYWRCDAAGRARGFLSFKFDPARVPDLPAPRPMYEIFVYSPRFEGVHLRGGKVARGGLRWSDRPEDFRTEVLGLVKAQMVKNAVIVPVGSKGGFVVKRVLPADREAYAQEGLECYRDFLRGLLDLTDNLVSGQIVPPTSVRRHDEDDPYLVVAADKGTARFSDHANEVAREYRFWLDDAFASGGSAGYDHKAMGITARGAWESVKRHFREMGIDTQSTAFTVAGIGDMSGDVFGNGMLRSRHIKLVAAFDHRHIFIDPDPDAEISYVERERLFRLPRSAWADYNAALLSHGGGVWPRSAKSIALSSEAAGVLGLEGACELTPNEVVSAILKAPVDLLYNGGVGTYVKAGAETHAEVGDRANDPVRVNGGELRSKVVGEGGNLGFTQRGRIEYALRGGRINTDAIDNSGGVDASDHEVNIKILLGIAIADGVLSEANRNALLAGMTDEVAQLVLRDNYFQNHALSLMAREGARGLDAQERLIIALEKAGRLDRAIEYLPDADAIALRRTQGVGLTRPELAVLLAYAKMWLYDEVVASPLPDDPWVETALARYFPTPLHEVYASCMARHPLRREIVATHVVNSMINRVGSTFVHQQQDATGMRAHEVVRAYLLARESFGAVELWRSIEALDNQVPVGVQARMANDLHEVLTRATAWFLRSPHLAQPAAAVIDRFTAGVNGMCARLRDIIDADAAAALEADVQSYVDAGVPIPLAQSIASHRRLYSALEMTDAAGESRRPLELVARVLFGLSAHVGLDDLSGQIDALPENGIWQVRAKDALRDDLSALQRTVVLQALRESSAGDPDTVVQMWVESAAPQIERARKLLQELRAASPDLAMLSVALRELRNLL